MAVCAPISSHRLDRANLRAPVALTTGARRLDAALTVAGVKVYQPGEIAGITSVYREYTPPKVLNDAAFLDAIPGIPLVFSGSRHPDGAVRGKHMGGGERFGTVLGPARFDTDAIIAPITVDDERDMQTVRQLGGGLSLAYEVEVDETPGIAPDGQRYDAIVTRIFNPEHVVPTRTPRARGARARTDSEGASMDPTELAEAIKTVVGPMIKPLLDEQTARQEEAKRRDAQVAARQIVITVPEGQDVETVRTAVTDFVAGKRKDATAEDWKPVHEAAAIWKVEIQGDIHAARAAVSRAILPSRQDAADHASLIEMALALRGSESAKPEPYRGVPTAPGRQDAAGSAAPDSATLLGKD